MLTPSELRNAQFSKARLGGYVMSEVDKLLDEVTPDYEALYKWFCDQKQLRMLRKQESGVQ